MGNTQRDEAQQQNESQDITEGDRFVAEDHDGSQFTINKTTDDSYPSGSTYISRTSSDGGKRPNYDCFTGRRNSERSRRLI